MQTAMGTYVAMTGRSTAQIEKGDMRSWACRAGNTTNGSAPGGHGPVAVARAGPARFKASRQGCLWTAPVRSR